MSESVAKNMAMGRLVVVTRLHSQAAINPDIIKGFLERAQPYADEILICFNGPDLQLQELLALAKCSAVATVLPVSPWGKFVAALNAATSYALRGGFTKLCFQSMEIRVPDPDAVYSLAAAVAPDTLVAGAALTGHAFRVGQHTIDGCTTPWNTLAVWDVRKLALLGFPLIADGAPASADGSTGEVEAGVEEVVAISLLQHLAPAGTMRAKLLKLAALSPASWDTDFVDKKREEWHVRKMESKIRRPAAQLSLLGLRAGVVEHIE